MSRMQHPRGAGRSRLAALLALASLCGAAPSARAEMAEPDIGGLLIGRTNYPAGAWALGAISTYVGADFHDPSRDVARFHFELEHGLTDRWAFEAGVMTWQSRRDLVTLDRAVVEARYLAVSRPFQLTAFAEYVPLLRQRSDAWGLGLEMLKNQGRRSVLLLGEAELGAERGHGRELSGGVHVTPFYRFGLQGLAGADWTYESDGSQFLGLMLGGALTEHIFLGVLPEVGLTRAAPDFELHLQLHFQAGPLELGRWIFE